MKIKRLSLGQLQANCYILSNDNTCIIIDPADDASFILEYVATQKLEVRALIATHGHFDHIMAVGEIQASFDVPFYISHHDMFLVNNMEKSASHFLDYTPTILAPTQVRDLSEGSIKLGQFNFMIHHLPGHTPGSCAFYFQKEKILFTGDTIFRHAVGRYDFSYSDLRSLKLSVQQVLSLPQEVVIYPGHGEETTVRDELKFNFFDFSLHS